jgi:hypothetical protein
VIFSGFRRWSMGVEVMGEKGDGRKKLIDQ